MYLFGVSVWLLGDETKNYYNDIDYLLISYSWCLIPLLDKSKDSLTSHITGKFSKHTLTNYVA